MYIFNSFFLLSALFNAALGNILGIFVSPALMTGKKHKQKNNVKQFMPYVCNRYSVPK